VRFHEAFLAKHGQQSLQSFRIAPTQPQLATAKTQKSIRNLAIQSLDRNLFLLQPPAEVRDYDDLLSDRVAPIALCGHCVCIGVEVFTQRPLAEPFNSF
jgi:hypothetical protein